MTDIPVEYLLDNEKEDEEGYPYFFLFLPPEDNEELNFDILELNF